MKFENWLIVDEVIRSTKSVPFLGGHPVVGTFIRGRRTPTFPDVTYIPANSSLSDTLVT